MTQANVLAQLGSAGVSQGFKNRIINGAMVIDQRNAGASVSETGAGQYTLDRWLVAGSGSAGIFSVQQSTDVPTGFKNSLKVTVTTSSASPGADESYQLQQRIEGLNVSDLAFGTASAKTVTLSFWVKSSVTGTMGGVLTNSDYNRTYPYEYTIDSANTWEYKTVTISGDTTGTWLTTNGTGLQVLFGFGAGTNRQATANTWANTVARIPSGSTQLIATNGATWYITGVQLEVGTSATEFEVRPYGTELQLCQRYFWMIADANNDPVPSTINLTGSQPYADFILPTPMRTAPSGYQVSSLYRFNGSSDNNYTGTWTVDGIGGGVFVRIGFSTTVSVGAASLVRMYESGKYFGLSAEL